MFKSKGLFVEDIGTLVIIEGQTETVADGIVLNITKPINIDGVKVKGLELAYLQQFSR